MSWRGLSITSDRRNCGTRDWASSGLVNISPVGKGALIISRTYLQGESTGRKKIDNIIMNRLSMAEKSVVKKSSSRNELECLGDELAGVQRRREVSRLTMVVTGPSYGYLV